MFITFRLARPMLIIFTILSVGFFLGLHMGMRGKNCSFVAAPAQLNAQAGGLSAAGLEACAALKANGKSVPECPHASGPTAFGVPPPPPLPPPLQLHPLQGVPR